MRTESEQKFESLYDDIWCYASRHNIYSESQLHSLLRLLQAWPNQRVPDLGNAWPCKSRALVRGVGSTCPFIKKFNGNPEPVLTMPGQPP